MSELRIRVYSPEPLLGHPLKMMHGMLADFWAGRELAWRLFKRDLSAQYRQTLLGYVWVFLPPLVAAMTFVFLNSQGIVQIKGTNIPYPAFAMMGTLLWQGFVDAIQMPYQAIAKARPMLAKINFPREAILLAGAYLVVFNLMVRLIILAGVMVVWRIVPGQSFLWFFPAVAGLITCGMAIGIVIAPIGSLYGDVGRGIPILAQFWMLLTPVLYPTSTTGMLSVLEKWNPASALVVTARESLTGEALTMLPTFLLVAVAAVVVLVIGCLGFRTAMPHLIARMGG